ncbi:MAG: radical SAM family heme chaperone HemW [Gammaproteobacteria bacterium]|nr:radical SAM family heme chaperone HemW [Gammaproteobacteria bacterium]
MKHLPLSLYVHLPWCVRKCPYCDFNSHEIKNGSFPEHEYVDALVRDLEFSAGLFQGREPVSVFLGGGTPSVMSPGAIGAILEAVDAVSGLSGTAEITLEANPGTADSERFAAYRNLGVNRLSIGVQSFKDAGLAAIGRIHDGDEAVSAVETAVGAGCSNINIDLMYGLPGQTVADAMADLAAAVSLEPVHISWYQLTIEPNTVFHAKPPPLPGDDLTWEMQNCGEEYLAGQGYRQYEVSAWSRPGSECRHNLNYWEFGDYIGVGAGAHGKITNGTVTRQSRLRVPQSYMRAAGSDAAIAATRTLNEQDCILEFMLNALRLKDGVPLSRFSARTGLAPVRVQAQVDAARADGLLEDEPSLLKATEKGARYLNDLLQYFMS